MKHKLLNKLWLRVGMIVAIMTTALAGTAWADNVTFTPSDFSGQGTASTGSAISATKSGVTIWCDKGYGTTELRCYSGGDFRISSDNTITDLSFTFSGGKTGGLETSYSDLSTTLWRVESLSSQARFSSITVTYIAPAATHSLTYSASPAAGGSLTVGSSNSSPATVAEGATVNISATHNTGYVFNGWMVTGTGSSVGDVSEASTTFTMGTENATLIANFTPVQTYTVTYKANTGTGSDIEETYNEGEDVTVAGNTFTKSGYAFTKWNTAADGSGEDYEPDDVIDDIAADIDLYAQWEESTEMTLSFDVSSNPGEWPSTNDATLTNYTYTLNAENYTFALKNVKCNSGYLMMTYVAVLGLPAIEGYKLTKVVASNSGGCSTATQVGISSSASSASYISGGASQTWSTTSSQYTYNLTSTVANTMYYMYVTNKNAQVTNLELTYEAVPTTYTVTYDGNGATGGFVPTDATAYSSGATVTVKGNTGSLVKAGFTFGGWNMQDDGQGTNYTAGNTFTISANTTLYAKWNAKTITGLSYTGTPTKTEYYAGENFSATGLTVTATFNDSSSEDVTSSVVWTPSPLTVGTTSVTGTYMGQTVNVTGLTVTAAPGSAANPYTVAQAIAAIDASEGTSNVYVRGIVCTGGSNLSSGSLIYWISDDGTETNKFEIYKGKGISNADFTSTDEIQVGDVVVVYGDITYYEKSGIYEFAAGSNLVSLVRQVATPTFSPAAGAVASGTEITISCATDDATIYYTTDGSTPSTSSTVYNPASKPTVTAATTFKAYAVKAGSPDSEVATAAYTISEPVANPTFDPDGGTYSSAQSVTISCTTPGAAIYYTTDGTEPTTGSTLYSGAINVDESMTIKAITVKADMANGSAQATYTINIPSITVSTNSINAPAAETEGTITVTYNYITSVVADVQFFEADGITPATYTWFDAEINASDNVDYVIAANTGAARTAYMKVYALDDEFNDVYSELITITQAKYEAPGSWAVVTNLADLTAKDVFVIVGNNGDTYALNNDNGASKSPDAVEITIENNALSGEVDDNLKWNISGNATDGYTFYPNGDDEKWLYCTNSNTGVRVGINEGKTFKVNNGYLQHVGTSRYVGIYSSQDWRCYTSINSNITGQSFAFYKKLAVTLNGNGLATFSSTCAIDYSQAEDFTAWVISSITENTIHLTQVTGAVPAGTGVLLYGTAGTTVYPTVAASGSAPAANLLTGITTATSVNANAYYGLSGNAFVKVNAGKIPAGKALLPASYVTEPGGVKTFTFVFEEDDATGINAIDNGELTIDNAAIYNLAGQRMNKMQKGINIVNGKKVMK